MYRILIIPLAFLLAVSVAIPQGSRGAIMGTVTDSAGALMPGVRIEAKNNDTDASYQVASTSTGSYTIPQLPAGTYQISVSLPGFKPYVRTGIAVLEAQIMRIDIVMAMLSSDEVLTNDSVIQLLKAGIDEDLIISKIRESQHNFDFSVQGMVALKEAGISGRLMRFMMDTSKPPDAKAAPDSIPPKEVSAKPPTPKESPKAAETQPANPEPAFPTEIGVYYKSNKQWVEIQPEVVVWQTGGMLKRFATAGIVQGDVNGRIKGSQSGLAIKAPLEFVIVTPEGVTMADYQLIHLRVLREAREFRTVTGGIFSSSGGATRDAVEFEGTKVLSRTFTVNLAAPDAGEYGFLPTGATSSTASANVGKMYTFQVIGGYRR